MANPNNALKTIKVTPIAAESLGVRSMCTLVETPDVAVLLDAGVSLAPYRFSLPPHPTEFQTIARIRQAIAEAADKTEVATISHYHYDHHTPSFEDWVVNWTEYSETARQIYQGKTVYTKNPKENINASQRQRAWMFQKTGGRYARSLLSADGRTITYGSTNLRFSEAVAHGEANSELGWVIMTTLDCNGERFMHAPDVQGPMLDHTLQLVLAQAPAVIMLGGPPLYLGGSRVEPQKVEAGLANLQRIVEAVPVVILEHHALRDEEWRAKMDKIFQRGKEVGHQVVTAAEYAGLENRFLEYNRKRLYEEQPPSEEFRQWMKTLNNQKIAKPPL